MSGKPLALRDIAFTRDRCQLCKGERKVRGGPCIACTEPRVLPPVARPCALQLSATPRSNGRQLRVRCECMSNVPARRAVDHRTPYDHLGDASSIPEARSMWDQHVRARRQ